MISKLFAWRIVLRQNSRIPLPFVRVKRLFLFSSPVFSFSKCSSLSFKKLHLHSTLPLASPSNLILFYLPPLCFSFILSLVPKSGPVIFLEHNRFVLLFFRPSLPIAIPYLLHLVCFPHLILSSPSSIFSHFVLLLPRFDLVFSYSFVCLCICFFPSLSLPLSSLPFFIFTFSLSAISLTIFPFKYAFSLFLPFHYKSLTVFPSRLASKKQWRQNELTENRKRCWKQQQAVGKPRREWVWPAKPVQGEEPRRADGYIRKIASLPAHNYPSHTPWRWVLAWCFETGRGGCGVIAVAFVLICSKEENRMHFLLLDFSHRECW